MLSSARLIFPCLLFLGFALASRAAAPALEAKDLPRTPPTAPKDAPNTFQVKPGFHLEIAAAEPLVMSPIDLCFDENGRMFVVEMIDYSERRSEQPHLGRIRMLEDTNQDGVFDKSTVYADNLPWPTAVFCYDGGIFVAATPDILFLKDTTGDGVADLRRVVFSGFASDFAPYETNKLNVQAMLNSFRWGLDNRIHGVTAPNGGKVSAAARPQDKPLDLRGRDFAFDPRRLTMVSEAGGGQYGMCFDDRGRRFTCSNSDHIRVFMYDDRYAARNPFHAMPSPLVSIAADGPSAEVYRLSPEEPWRVIRTQWRVGGLVPGPIEGGGRASGYFTSATGLTLYRGNAYPKDYEEDAFIADCGSNLVHRKKLYPDGLDLIAKRPPGEEKVEFLASRDLWFRPVQFANAPDGTLYMVDMYREIIEHPWSLPKPIKQYLDLNSGHDRGRIYRIAPDGFQPPKPPRLGHASAVELVATLAHPNAWHRETAARLLYERQDQTAVLALSSLLRDSLSPLGRMHAVHVLDGLQALTAADVQQGLRDADDRVREHAVLLSEKFFAKPDPASASLWESLLALTADPSIPVRFQLAFTLGEIRRPGTVQALTRIVRRDAASRWMAAAVLSSLAEGTGQMFAALTGDEPFSSTPAGQDFLRQLTAVIGAKNAPAENALVLNFLAGHAQSPLAFSLLRSFGNGLQRAKSSLAVADPQNKLKAIYEAAAKLIDDNRAGESLRVEAIQLLASARWAGFAAQLFALLDPAQSQTVQLAALGALARSADAGVGRGLVERWAALTPRLRAEGVTALLARPERIALLLKAVEDGVIARSELASTEVKFLQTHRDPDVRRRAKLLFGQAPTKTARQDLVEHFQPALQRKGDAAHGQAIYLERCASCHRLGGHGHALGPDLASVKSSGKDTLLINILDPNRQVAPNYISYVIETKDDESMLGLIANENANSITVRQANDVETVVLRSNIRSMKSQGQSVMPEGLEAGLGAQDLADLLEYISATEEPKR